MSAFLNTISNHVENTFEELYKSDIYYEYDEKGPEMCDSIWGSFDKWKNLYGNEIAKIQNIFQQRLNGN